MKQAYPFRAAIHSGAIVAVKLALPEPEAAMTQDAIVEALGFDTRLAKA